MPCVYRYIDLKDNIIKYVGIVHSPKSSLLQRCDQHSRNDSWCKGKKWRIEYIEDGIDTRSEAEAYESHYIELYETYKYFNKAKAKFGLNKYLPEKEWKLFISDATSDKNGALKINWKNKEQKVENLFPNLSAFEVKIFGILCLFSTKSVVIRRGEKDYVTPEIIAKEFEYDLENVKNVFKKFYHYGIIGKVETENRLFYMINPYIYPIYGPDKTNKDPFFGKTRWNEVGHQ